MNRLPSEIGVMQGHGFIADVLARNKTPMRSIAECEAILDDHAELTTGRPMAKSTTRAKVISAALASKRRAGRRVMEEANRRHAYARN